MSEKIRFVIIASPRTGTNHFIQLLTSHPDITCHYEVFHPDSVYLFEGARADLLNKRNRNPLAFLRKLFDACPTRACGFKIFMEHDDSVLEAILRDRVIKKIILYRSNPLAVYSSDKIAEAERRYLIAEDAPERIDAGAKDAPRTRAKAIFDREDFELYLDIYQSHYRHAVEVLNETNQDYMFLTYEDYVNESLFRRVFPFLGLSQPKELWTYLKKMNSGYILSRFVNPDDVRSYLLKIGKPNWAYEDFMLWSQPQGAVNLVHDVFAESTEGAPQNEKPVSIPGVSQLEPGFLNFTDAEEKSAAISGRNTKKRTLLFVDYATPQYDMFAGSRTNFMYLALLVRMGLNVKFLPADFRRLEPYSSALNDLGVITLDSEWYRDNWENWLQDNGLGIDYVFFHRPDPTMKFLESVKRHTKAIIIYQCHDLHYLRLQRKAEVKQNQKLLAEASLYKKKEDFIFSGSDVVLTFSEVEYKIIKERFPFKQVFTVPLFFYEKMPMIDRDFSRRRDLLFVGGCDHTPNRDAVLWFCAEVLPLIRKQIPEIVFNAVGANPTKDILALQSKNIRILGRVSEEKLQKIYKTVKLAVIPLRFGAGVKGKIIEALYNGVPVVSTSIGLEGIKGIDQIFEAKDDPAGFAAQVVSLYRDGGRLQELSERGSDLVSETFTSQKTAELMNNILSSCRKEDAGASVSPIPEMSPESPRLIAFYLPHYYPTQENDEWWGKGFTEWRNVAKAKPLFTGHYQPHIPADMGFYDLRLEETRVAQAELAEEYGIYGFCYYHYWFHGKRLLERPLNDMLDSKKPDFPFCICWANEDLTGRSDGEDHRILMKMEYSEDDDRRHIRELFRVFEDPRYIRVNGKPLFLVYRTENIPDPARTAGVWRAEARKAGIGELYLVRVESIGQTDPKSIGFDAAMEFAPDWNNKGPRVKANNENALQKPLNLEIPNDLCGKNHIHYYDELADNMMKKLAPNYRWFRCVTPSSDNSAQRPDKADIFLDSTPEKYQKWLKEAIEYTKTRLNGEERIVFINAWNEWSGGSHLEPDQKFGRSYLEATRQALREATHTTVTPFLYASGQTNPLSQIDKLLIDRKREIAQLERQLSAKDIFIEDREFDIEDRELRIRQILESVSWRATGPLRRVHEILSKLMRKGRG